MTDVRQYEPGAPSASNSPTQWLPAVSGYSAVLFCGAIFGFFYAWSSSSMIGFDSADPRVAIAAMQAVNDSIRNAYFFPSFFLTPIVAAVAAFLHRRSGSGTAAILFAAAALVYLFGGIMLTAVVHIPLNDELGELAVPAAESEAKHLWDDYSGQWQVWNWVRTGFSGLALLLSAAGLRAGARQRGR